MQLELQPQQVQPGQDLFSLRLDLLGLLLLRLTPTRPSWAALDSALTWIDGRIPWNTRNDNKQECQKRAADSTNCWLLFLRFIHFISYHFISFRFVSFRLVPPYFVSFLACSWQQRISIVAEIHHNNNNSNNMGNNKRLSAILIATKNVEKILTAKQKLSVCTMNVKSWSSCSKLNDEC